ncbi:AMP-binding protein [Leucobacter sp. CSA1]|uniref:AMP-binding protein n=1 Tax=Leucobacter chromiisoli TaxID=2796471 RepID=A0A934Q6Z0_9MICO|nr:AMP-binding protein [Leucobacter chromiisoli]
MHAALADALAGGAPVLPVPADTPPETVSAVQGAELPQGAALVIRTSGSTGTPKSVALSADALRSSAEATLEELGGAGQWLVSLPTNLISGVQMLVRSIVAGTEPVFAPDRFDPEALLERAEELDEGRRYVSLVPVQFTRLLDLAARDRDAAEALRRFDAVLVGGQAMTLDLRRRAHELGVPLRRSYGMTETAGGCVYDGVEIGDTRVRIRGGEVQLAGSALALGYVGDPARTAERFIEEIGADGAGSRWYRTGDAGELLGGMLTVTGRLDRVIVSGGVNVSLDEVERAAREHAGWSSAVAIGSEHPEWGERVTLVVETEEGAAGFDEVKAAIRERLGPAAAPVWVTETDRIPRLAGGKPDLPAIHAWIGMLRASFKQTGA